jgi:mRNA-degrading endonuclease RelE of RelBE toxin-antitoxin system
MWMLKDFYRIRDGKVRILFEFKNDEIKITAIITDIDFRGEIYK